MSNQFNTEQLKAIKHKDGPMLVIAGPGSGKTTVAIHRIYNLISCCGVHPENILAISFTNAAADEMRDRFLRLSKGRGSEVTFGTFHSVFYMLLRRYLKGSELELISHGESLNLLKQTVQNLYPDLMASNDYLELMLTEISRYKNGMSNVSRRVKELIPVYDKAMHGKGRIDFDDMLVIIYKLLKNDKNILNEIRDAYRYIMVDEFQDINRIQFAIVRLMSDPRSNLFAVGDDDQSIYGFRGSDPGIMLSFGKYYRHTHMVSLTVNYRSQRDIAEPSFRLIGYNKKRYKKELKSVRPSAGRIDLREFDDREKEAECLKSMLECLPEDKSAAVLYRTHRAGSRAVYGIKRAGLDKRKNIAMMTFHGSKGLEFDEVFIIEANEGITPMGASDNDRDALEEERRMFYVAVTRSKNMLHIFYTKGNYNNKNKRSRFIKELGL